MMSSAWSQGMSFSRSVSEPCTVSLVMMLSPVKSAITCSTERTSMLWKLNETFSPLYPPRVPCVRRFGSSCTGLISTMNRLSA